jgi:hypothetical protein
VPNENFIGQVKQYKSFLKTQSFIVPEYEEMDNVTHASTTKLWKWIARRRNT